MSKIKLTYFTPTYNREKLLLNLYQSLLNQTNKNFIWLIIDDGSKDGTEQLVKSWQKENKIQIEYVKKENGGKHTAIELSNQVCTTEFIACIDSDDTLTKEATEVILKHTNNISDPNIVGMVGRRDLVGFTKHKEANWPENDTFLYFPELSTKYGFNFDTILIFRTEIIKNYHFPIFEDERFVTESVYYNMFVYDYKMLAFEEFVYIGEYQPDGYTSQGMNLFFKNPKGYACCLKQIAWLNIKNKHPFKKTIKNTMVYYGWKKLFKLKGDFLPECKLPFIHRLVGSCTDLLSKSILKKKYNLNKDSNEKH